MFFSVYLTLKLKLLYVLLNSPEGWALASRSWKRVVYHQRKMIPSGVRVFWWRKFLEIAGRLTRACNWAPYLPKFIADTAVRSLCFSQAWPFYLVKPWFFNECARSKAFFAKELAERRQLCLPSCVGSLSVEYRSPKTMLGPLLAFLRFLLPRAE